MIKINRLDWTANILKKTIFWRKCLLSKYVLLWDENKNMSLIAFIIYYHELMNTFCY